MKKITLVSIAFLLSLIIPSFADPASKNINKIVFTMEAPVVNGSNHIRAFFDNLLQGFNENGQKTSLAKEIEASGSSWRIISNSSNIQVAMILATETEKAKKLCLKAAKIIKAAQVIKTNTSTLPTIGEQLYATSKIQSKESNQTKFSLYIEGPLENFKSEIEIPQATQTSKIINEQNIESISNVQKALGKNSALAKLMSWDDISPSSFISAKFAGERFIQSFANTRGVKFEIWFHGAKTFLALIIEGSENQIIGLNQRMESFSQNITGDNEKNAWKAFLAGATNLFTEDSRDLHKSILTKALLAHFEAKNKIEDGEENFIPPTKSQSFYFVGADQVPDFSFSANEALCFATYQTAAESNITDISVAISADSKTLEAIKSLARNVGQFEFPLTISAAGSETVLIQCHSENSHLIKLLSALNAKFQPILSAAAKSLKKNSMMPKVAIAAVSDQPALLVRGKLQHGWPQQSQPIELTIPSQESIFEILDIKNLSPEGMQSKYNLLISTPKGKAALLAQLGLNGFKIQSF